MIYFKVAWFAVQRYRLEAPFRQRLLADGLTMKKLRRMHFGQVLSAVKKRQLVGVKEANRINDKYRKYSKYLHGYKG